jgi:hypothetical protein
MSLVQDGTRQHGPNRFGVVLDSMKEGVAHSQLSHLQQDACEFRTRHPHAENDRDVATLSQSLHGQTPVIGRQQRRIHDKRNRWGLQIEKSELHPIL